MSIKITLDIFSGRTNPTWELTKDQIEVFKKKLDQLKEKTDLKTPGAYYGLGYRGFIIETTDEADLPEEMIANGGLVDFGWALEGYLDEKHEIEFWLLESAGNVLAKEVKTLAKEGIQKDRNSFGFFDHSPGRDEPPFDPGWWNNNRHRRLNNNCYNYGCNIATDTFAKPGRQAGEVYQNLTCPDVGIASNADGLRARLRRDLAGRPSLGHFVALVVGPGIDFHWYRRDSDGLWSHKPGSTRVTRYDNSRNIIRDPETANRGIYTDFCGYYLVSQRVSIL